MPSVQVAGETVRALTACRTFRAAVPATLPVVAVMVAAPLPMAVAVPVLSMLATAAASLVQVNRWPLIGLPFWSKAWAVKVPLAPIAFNAALAGVTVTVVTTGGGGGGGG